MNSRRGSALLMVLWLTAALAAIAFSVALTVRADMERSASGMDGLRAYYLACGAADRAVNYMLYGPGPRDPAGQPLFWEPGVPFLKFAFPEGEAVVEIIPETAKMSVNTATPEELERLFIALGRDPMQARHSALAIVDWRGGGSGSAFDSRYSGQGSSFRAPHASFEQIEDLMSVAGITPELFYGGYIRTSEGELVPRPGLKDCLSVYSQGSSFDINTVSPAVMLAVGVPAPTVAAIDNLRRKQPILRSQFASVAEQFLGPAAGKFRLGGEKIYTLRATARLRAGKDRLSDLRRTVAMTVQLQSQQTPEGFRVLAWQDNAAGRMLFDVWPN